MPIKVGKLMFVLAVFDYVVVMTMNAPEVVGIVAAENVLLVHLFVVAVVANWPILVDLPIPNVAEVEPLNRLIFQSKIKYICSILINNIYLSLECFNWRHLRKLLILFFIIVCWNWWKWNNAIV
jgi:hypothetical protein